MNSEEETHPLYAKLRKLITLIDQLRDCGVSNYIKLPRICVLGTQSSGKSSVLESIVGLDFLPRGDGVVTRRPLELRLNHLNAGVDVKPFAVFDEIKGEKFTDFSVVRKKIEELTDKKAGGNKNIIDDPIILNISSPTCPDLTLVDLPGITRIPLKDSDQPKDIEKITKNMASRYCEDQRTIILCVIPGNQDITVNDGLQMARDIDPRGDRTIGVITKIDIMDPGTDAKKTLLGHEVELKYGYVGVKNRSKQDIIDNVGVTVALDKERNFFRNHPIYRTMPPGYLGTDILVNKLTKILFKQIKQFLPEIIKEINNKIKECEDSIQLLGQPLPVDTSGKQNLLWNMMSEYCETYKNVLKGKYDQKRHSYIKDEGGYKIKALYKDLINDFTGDYKATATYTDDYINEALIIHEGDSIPGFPSADAFFYLLKPELEKLREPINECLSEVFSYLEMLSTKILEKTFTRFPRLIDDVNDFVSAFLHDNKEKARYLVESIVDMEINYLFTNDYEYLNNYTTFIPKNQEKGVQVDSKNIFIREIRNRIEAYFKLVVRNLRDSIPKALGHFLVRAIQENMQLTLYNQIYSNSNIVSVLDEPEHIRLEREVLTKTLGVLKNAQKVIKRDPDILQIMNAGNDEKFEPKEEKPVSKQSAVVDSKPERPVNTSSSQPTQASNEPRQVPQNNMFTGGAGGAQRATVSTNNMFGATGKKP